MAGLFFCALLMPAPGLPRGPAASRNYRLRTFGASGTRFIGLLTQLSRVLQENPRHPPKSFYRMRHGQSPTPHSRLLQRGCATINESGGAVHFGEPVAAKRSKEDRDQRQHARLSATPPADERRFTKCCCRWLAALSVAAEHVQRPRSSDRTFLDGRQVRMARVSGRRSRRSAPKPSQRGPHAEHALGWSVLLADAKAKGQSALQLANPIHSDRITLWADLRDW